MTEEVVVDRLKLMMHQEVSENLMIEDQTIEVLENLVVVEAAEDSMLQTLMTEAFLHFLPRKEEMLNSPLTIAPTYTRLYVW